jgi:hypothetical protein
MIVRDVHQNRTFRTGRTPPLRGVRMSDVRPDQRRTQKGVQEQLTETSHILASTIIVDRDRPRRPCQAPAPSPPVAVEHCAAMIEARAQTLTSDSRKGAGGLGIGTAHLSTKQRPGADITTMPQRFRSCQGAHDLDLGTIWEAWRHLQAYRRRQGMAFRCRATSVATTSATKPATHPAHGARQSQSMGLVCQARACKRPGMGCRVGGEISRRGRCDLLPISRGRFSENRPINRVPEIFGRARLQKCGVWYWPIP